MDTVIRKLNKQYFTSVVINVIVDDLGVFYSEKDDDLQVIINSTSNIESDISDHFLKSGRYDPSLRVDKNVLYIDYRKESMLLLSNIKYIEMTGCIISIPLGIPYKIITDENEI